MADCTEINHELADLMRPRPSSRSPTSRGPKTCTDRGAQGAIAQRQLHRLAWPDLALLHGVGAGKPRIVITRRQQSMHQSGTAPALVGTGTGTCLCAKVCAELSLYTQSRHLLAKRGRTAKNRYGQARKCWGLPNGQIHARAAKFR